MVGFSLSLFVPLQEVRMHQKFERFIKALKYHESLIKLDKPVIFKLAESEDV